MFLKMTVEVKMKFSWLCISHVLVIFNESLEEDDSKSYNHYVKVAVHVDVCAD